MSESSIDTTRTILTRLQAEHDAAAERMRVAHDGYQHQLDESLQEIVIDESHVLRAKLRMDGGDLIVDLRREIDANTQETMLLTIGAFQALMTWGKNHVGEGT